MTTRKRIGRSEKEARPRRGAPRASVQTAGPLSQIHKYFKGESTAETCARDLGISKQTFFTYLRDAYQQGFLRLCAPQDEHSAIQLFKHFSRIREHWLETVVLSGQPDQKTFAQGAAEKVLDLFKGHLFNRSKSTLVVGVIGGSTISAVVDELLGLRNWKDMIKTDFVHSRKHVYLLALNMTPSWGQDLVTSSVVIVAKIAASLQACSNNCRVYPIGLSSDLLIKDDAETLLRVDENAVNRRVVSLADPCRLPAETRKKTIRKLEEEIGERGLFPDNQRSHLDLVITSVGGRDTSVFTDVLREESINVGDDIVGDVAFSPVNREGKRQLLTRGDNENYRLYSAIGLETIRQLAQSREADVCLIARNYRRDSLAKKTEIIRAAIEAEYANVIITDANTSESLIGKGDELSSGGVGGG